MILDLQIFFFLKSTQFHAVTVDFSDMFEHSAWVTLGGGGSGNPLGVSQVPPPPPPASIHCEAIQGGFQQACQWILTAAGQSQFPKGGMKSSILGYG